MTVPPGLTNGAGHSYITPHRLRVLGALGKGPATVSVLARRTGLDSRTISGILRTARRRNLVWMALNPVDKRYPRWGLLDDGKELVDSFGGVDKLFDEPEEEPVPDIGPVPEVVELPVEDPAEARVDVVPAYREIVEAWLAKCQGGVHEHLSGHDIEALVRDLQAVWR